MTGSGDMGAGLIDARDLLGLGEHGNGLRVGSCDVEFRLGLQQRENS